MFLRGCDRCWINERGWINICTIKILIKSRLLITNHSTSSMCIKITRCTVQNSFWCGNPSSGDKTTKAFLKNSFPEITGRREQTPYYIDFNFPASTGRRLWPPDLQATTWRKLPLPSFSDSTKRRLWTEGSFHFLVFWLQPEGGDDLLSFPRPATLVRRGCWSCGPVTHQTLHFLVLITSAL